MLRHAILSFLCISYATTNSIPSYFPRCNRDDPNLVDCIIRATEVLKPQIRKGVKELGIPSLDPFVVPEVTLQQGNGALTFTIGLQNVVMNGLENYKFTKLDYDVKKHVLTGVVTFEKLYLSANYNFVGSLFLSPLKGKGVLKAFTGPSVVTFDLHGKEKVKNGKTYLKPKHTQVKLKIGSPAAYFDGSINDNEQLSAATSKILNDNVQELVTAVVPQIELATSGIVAEFWDRTVGEVPHDELLPGSS